MTDRKTPEPSDPQWPDALELLLSNVAPMLESLEFAEIEWDKWYVFVPEDSDEESDFYEVPEEDVLNWKALDLVFKGRNVQSLAMAAIDEETGREPEDWNIELTESEEAEVRQTQNEFYTACQEQGISYIENRPFLGAHFLMGWSDPFTKEWYEAAIGQEVYQLRQLIPIEDHEEFGSAINKAFYLGKLVSELAWRNKYYSLTVLGQKNFEATKSATHQREKDAGSGQRQRLACVLRLYQQAIEERGEAAMRKDTNAAYAIFDMAEKSRPRELVIKSTEKIRSPETIRRMLPAVRQILQRKEIG